MFIDPKRAPSWKRTPKLSRMVNSSSSLICVTLRPNTRMSPASGYMRATMCLRSTLLPVPDGPRTVVMAPSTKLTVSPSRTFWPPKALWTSSTSMAAGSTAVISPSPWSVGDGCSRREPPEDLGAHHPDEVDEHHVEHHRLGG